MRKTNSKYLWLIPPLYFMLLGIGFTGMELYHHLTNRHWYAIYALMCLPVITRNNYVFLCFGGLMASIFGCFLLVLLGWLTQYLAGENFDDPGVIFGVGFLFCGTSFLMAVLLAVADSKGASAADTPSPSKVNS